MRGSHPLKHSLCGLQWGNSLALRILKAVAKQIQIQEGDPVFLKVGTAGLTVKAIPKGLELDDLLKKVTPENVRPERDWGADRRREALQP